ncbi:MAG TPA: HD domain-containing protein [bacterium]|jgi:hypothetical protein
MHKVKDLKIEESKTGEIPSEAMSKAIADDLRVNILINAADKYLDAIGYTEHGRRHTRLVASRAREIALTLGYSRRMAERAYLAGLLHDVGNMLGRPNHGQTGSLMVYPILVDHGLDYVDIATILTAISNHEEEYGIPVDETAACLIIADKTDVHRSRVRYPDPNTHDIHDRVNLAAQRCRLSADPEERAITAEVTIDTAIASVMEYFEIFTSRMVMVRKSCRLLGCKFRLIINGTELS